MRLVSASFAELDPFDLFDELIVAHNADDVHGDALILWGGEDIGTSIYKEKPNKYCISAKPSFRDSNEIAMIEAAIKREIPIIGICRGAQLMCCVAGGSLMQHIDGHTNNHLVTLHDEDNMRVKCNSSHHQMMMPPVSAKILASAAETTGLNQFNGVVTIPQVPEVVYFPSINGLGIQPHPEWPNCPSDFKDYCIRKIKEYLL